MEMSGEQTKRGVNEKTRRIYLVVHGEWARDICVVSSTCEPYLGNVMYIKVQTNNQHDDFQNLVTTLVKM